MLSLRNQSLVPFPQHIKIVYVELHYRENLEQALIGGMVFRKAATIVVKELVGLVFRSTHTPFL